MGVARFLRTLPELAGRPHPRCAPRAHRPGRWRFASRLRRPTSPLASLRARAPHCRPGVLQYRRDADPGRAASSRRRRRDVRPTAARAALRAPPARCELAAHSRPAVRRAGSRYGFGERGDRPPDGIFVDAMVLVTRLFRVGKISSPISGLAPIFGRLGIRTTLIRKLRLGHVAVRRDRPVEIVTKTRWNTRNRALLSARAADRRDFPSIAVKKPLRNGSKDRRVHDCHTSARLRPRRRLYL